MTREEAKEIFLNRGVIDGIYNGDKWREACIVISKWLEQEPTTKNCETCRYYGSHHEVCNYCYKCSLWTEKEPTTKNNLEVDAISREQALNEFCIYNSYDSIGVDKVRSYLKALPSVTPQNQVYPPCEDCHIKMDEVRRAYDNAMKQAPILDKIRAEIVELQKEYQEYGWAYDDALEIIDKYKSESEPQESEE